MKHPSGCVNMTQAMRTEYVKRVLAYSPSLILLMK